MGGGVAWQRGTRIFEPLLNKATLFLVY